MALSRRSFLTRSLAMAPLAPALAHPRAHRANDKLRVAVIGVRGQGKTHIAKFQSLPGVEVVALCDADADVLDATAAAFEKKHGRRPQTYGDLRRVFDAKDIDIVSTATPNHWHALIGIWACESGKDAYIEKPVSHNVWEGRQLVAAARKHGRIVQGGTQSRSQLGIRAAVQMVRDGQLGALQWVHGLCYKPRKSIGKVGHGALPKRLDYDLWCGPAPHEPLRRKELHYDWHWQWATGNGDLGNQGIHQVDVGRWLLGAGLPARVLSVGGRFGYDDDGETPNTQLVWFDYGAVPFVFEVRGLPNSRAAQAQGDWGKVMDVVPGFERSGSIGVVAHCAQGRMVIDTGRARHYDGDGKLVAEFKDDGDHYANFIAAVRSRDGRELHSDVEETHLSSALCHLGGISHLLGQRTARATAEAAFDAKVQPALADLLAHLGRNEVATEQSLVLGRPLTIDAASERIAGDHAASALLTRPYRRGFAVPTLA